VFPLRVRPSPPTAALFYLLRCLAVVGVNMGFLSPSLKIILAPRVLCHRHTASNSSATCVTRVTGAVTQEVILPI
jgi:hypothetical protein